MLKGTDITISPPITSRQCIRSHLLKRVFLIDKYFLIHFASLRSSVAPKYHKYIYTVLCFNNLRVSLKCSHNQSVLWITNQTEGGSVGSSSLMRKSRSFSYFICSIFFRCFLCNEQRRVWINALKPCPFRHTHSTHCETIRNCLEN